MVRYHKPNELKYSKYLNQNQSYENTKHKSYIIAYKKKKKKKPIAVPAIMAILGGCTKIYLSLPSMYPKLYPSLSYSCNKKLVSCY